MATKAAQLTLGIVIAEFGRGRFRAATRIGDRPLLGSPAASEVEAVTQLFAALGNVRNDDVQVALDLALSPFLSEALGLLPPLAPAHVEGEPA